MINPPWERRLHKPTYPPKVCVFQVPYSRLTRAGVPKEVLFVHAEDGHCFCIDLSELILPIYYSQRQQLGLSSLTFPFSVSPVIEEDNNWASLWLF